MKVVDVSQQDHSPPKVLPIVLQPGSAAPRYPASTFNLKIEKVVITERGTQSNLPIVDLQLVGHDGEKFFTCLTGRHLLALAAAIRGVNARNHGTEEP